MNVASLQYANVLQQGEWGKLVTISLKQLPAKDLRPGEDAGPYFEQVLDPSSIAPPPDASTLALHRFKIWWLRPVFSYVPPETILLLWSDTPDEYRLLLPVYLPSESSVGFTSSSLRQREDGRLAFCGNHPIAGLYVGKASDPFALIHEGVQMALGVWAKEDEQEIPVLRPDNGKAVQQHRLGWCTWNAFYLKLTGVKVIEAVRLFQEEYGIPIRWMILDDGWQHTTVPETSEFGTAHRLRSLQEDPKKFTELSLKETIDTLRSEHNMESFWVWHTLFGYWLGLENNKELPKSTLHFPYFPSGILDNDPTMSKEASVELGVGVADNPYEFFDRYHRDFLSSQCGVDGVKVDGQALNGVLRRSKETPEKRPDVLQALAESVKMNFSERGHPSVITCMAHAPEIFYRLPALYDGRLPFIRASDDFFPNDDHSHGRNIVASVFNSLLFRHIAVPDWDMFQTTLSDTRYVRMNAIARCISGGPVYLSNTPAVSSNKLSSREAIDWICCSDGTTLVCREAALPIASCLLCDPLDKDASPLVIFNTNGSAKSVTNGVFGIFGLAGSGEWDYTKLGYVGTEEKTLPSVVSVRPSDIPCFAADEYVDTEFVMISFFSQQVKLLPSSGSSLDLELPSLESEAVAVLPVSKLGSHPNTLDFVALGLAGRINGAGAIIDLRAIPETLAVEMKLRGHGTFLFAHRAEAESTKVAVYVDDVLIPCNQAESGAIPKQFAVLGLNVMSFELERGSVERNVQLQYSK